MDQPIYDVIIVGGGPAGVSASIYAKKSGLSVLLINGSHLKSDTNFKIENHYGFNNGILYSDLANLGLSQAEKFGVTIINEACYEYYQEKDLQVCITSTKHYSKTLVIATGIHYRKLPLSNFDKYVGQGIHFCTLCDGFLYRNKKVVLYGYGSYLIHEYEYLKEICSDITIYTTSNEELEQYNFDHPVINNSEITQIIGNDDKITSLIINGKEVLCDGLFVALGSPNSHSLATTAGIHTKEQRIVVNEHYETNLSGIFAIGDVIKGETQIAKSLYEGMKVAEIIKTRIRMK